jgi:FAD synthetase
MSNEYLEELHRLYPKQKEPFKVMIAGTFDIIHTGHIALINEAAKIGKVHVIVARDSSVKKFKGQPPIFPEVQRLSIVRSLKSVEWAELGSETEDWMLRIAELNPQMFLLGPNQFGEPDKFEKQLRLRNCATIFRRMKKMDEEFPLNSSTKIKQEIVNRYKSKSLNSSIK